MQTKVEMLTSVHVFLDLQLLLKSVERLIKGEKFSGLGDSNVMQFEKDCTDINFGVCVNLVSGKRKAEKASNVKALKNQVIQLFQTSQLLDISKICLDELQVTAL